mmetsp:Transcript_10010/g.28696  ORF Transcript_10010/g.28696 Transcript_10010/m.28696 type:complete len:108 (+) Transcript_10010:917-1240(+)
MPAHCTQLPQGKRRRRRCFVPIGHNHQVAGSRIRCASSVSNGITPEIVDCLCDFVCRVNGRSGMCAYPACDKEKASHGAKAPWRQHACSVQPRTSLGLGGRKRFSLD